MANTFMASLGESLVQVNTVSESNSVQYKLNIAGVHRYSSPLTPYVRLNDSLLGSQVHSNGLNVRVLDANNNVIDQKEFILTNIDSTINSAFITYMNSLTSGIVIITSGQLLKSSPQIDNWFKSVYSINWPGEFLCNNYDVAYAAFYSPVNKRITSEVYNSSDGFDSSRATLEMVYDSVSDLGATGYSYKAIYDPTEYTSNSQYEFKRYPTSQVLISLLSDYGILPGRTMLMQCELKASNALIQANMTTRLSLRWYTGSTLIDSKSYEVNSLSPDKWIKFEDYIVVPANANGFTMVVARYPRNDAIIAEASIKNLIFCEVGRSAKYSGDAAIGVNGIKAGTINESTTSPRIMNLPDSVTNINNVVDLSNVQELPLPY